MSVQKSVFISKCSSRSPFPAFPRRSRRRMGMTSTTNKVRPRSASAAPALRAEQYSAFQPRFERTTKLPSLISPLGWIYDVRAANRPLRSFFFPVLKKKHVMLRCRSRSFPGTGRIFFREESAFVNKRKSSAKILICGDPLGRRG